jgi:dipeptidyl-peptidase-4
MLWRGMIFRLLLAVLFPVSLFAAAPDFRDAESLGKRTEGKIFGDRVDVHFPTEGEVAWYKVNAAKGDEFFSLNLSTGETKSVAKEEVPKWKPRSAAVVNASRSRNTGGATQMVFKNETAGVIKLFWLDLQGKPVSYGEVAPGKENSMGTYAGHVWQVRDAADKPLGKYQAENDTLEVIIAAQTAPAAESEKKRARKPQPPTAWRIDFREHNVFAHPQAGGDDVPLTTDGTSGNEYTGPAVWNGAGTHVALFRVERVKDVRQVHYIESSPKDQLQPKHTTQNYAKPGDPIDQRRLSVFNLEDKKLVPVSDALFPTPWSLDNLEASADGKSFRLLYNQRGHQVLRLLSIDAATGSVRVLAEEAPRTFVDYTNKVWQQFLPTENEFLWMSERDGFNHIYRMETATGNVLTQVTKGAWMVRKVERVDTDAKQLWFTAMGVRPGQDPYFKHLCRVNFDGTGMVILTESDGTHQWEFSPDGKFIVDRWSRLDQPTVTELRSAADGKLIAKLAEGNFTALRATGWQPAERFVAKGRDGTTDIYGMICRPTNFDPAKKYPVVEKIYAGPQDFFVPKEFRMATRDRELCELGFILVQIDGMGTNWRGKAFHDVCFKNLGDGGFPDRIAWMKAAADKHPEMDLSRVGIYGGSAGGQNALGALLRHGDFYKAAAADCGCHDNRMDKIWWNEQWMSWPIGKEYDESSNVVNAHKLQGHLLLTWGELDNNVDPSSSMQVVNALVKANKEFEMFIVPGAGHGIGESPYLHKKRMAFFHRWLQ